MQSDTMPTIHSLLTLESLNERLGRIESMLTTMVEREQVREFYTTDQFAKLVELSPWMVRQYCNEGRIRAKKKNSGRGAYLQWVIPHAELERYRAEGLLPQKPR